MIKGHDFMKPLSQQLDVVLPHLVDHDAKIDRVLPFYIAVTAKLSGKSAEEVFVYNMKSLEAIFGSSTEGKSQKEKAESEYAYLVNAKAREIFDLLPDVK